MIVAKIATYLYYSLSLYAFEIMKRLISPLLQDRLVVMRSPYACRPALPL